MKIGIPRALLYFKNEKFRTTYFNEIGVEYIISPETNKEILTRGENLAIDETCLPTKLLLGHIDWLIGKCANHCEIICVYKEDELIDSWGNKCDNGAVKTKVRV